jgi:predicted SAM-dependent methyltransferase
MERTIEIKCSHVGGAYFMLNEAKKFITPDMNGLDVGSGGTPIFIQSISLDDDKPAQYSELVQLKGNAANLYWFRDGVLDYLFSSHCFEDFVPADRVAVMQEWIRVIKPSGFLLLDLPTEVEYRAWCVEAGQVRNMDHKDPNFSVETIRDLMNKNFPNLKEVHFLKHGWSFFIVYKKD